MSEVHAESRIDGYITVEASLLLPIIFGVLWILLYLMFYVMESAFISGTMEECAVLYGPYQTEVSADGCGTQTANRIEQRCFFAKEMQTTVKQKGEKLKLLSSASHILPIRRQLTIQTEHPIEEIRRREWIEEAVQNGGD